MDWLNGADIRAFFIVLAGALGLFVLIVNAKDKWDRLTESPCAETADMVAAHTKMLERDKKRLDEADEMRVLVLLALLQLIEHELSGNHVEKLKEIRDRINEYLINR